VPRRRLVVEVNVPVAASTVPSVLPFVVTLSVPLAGAVRAVKKPAVPDPM